MLIYIILNFLIYNTQLSRFACPDLTSKEGYWAKALPERYSVAGSILHFYVNAEGELYYGINGVLKGQFLNGINVFSPLWVIVDIYGNSSSLEFIGKYFFPIVIAVQNLSQIIIP